MSRRLLLCPRAERDIQSIYEWYEANEGKQLVFGEEFLFFLRERLVQLQRRPEDFPVVHRDVRWAVIRQLPYLVFYVPQPTCVTVLAVLHHARNPTTRPLH